jgi:hypothetical protein
MDPEPKRRHIDVDEMEVDEPTKSNGSFKKFRVAIHTTDKILIKKYYQKDGTFRGWNVLGRGFKTDDEIPVDIACSGPIHDIVMDETGVDLSIVEIKEVILVEREGKPMCQSMSQTSSCPSKMA